MRYREVLEDRLEEEGAGSPIESYERFVNPRLAEGLRALQWTEEFRSGRGGSLIDEQGREYLDMIGCYGAAVLGHAPEVLERAVQQFLEQRRPGLQALSIPELAGPLAEELCRASESRFGKVHFACGGSEAMEGALKLASFAVQRSRFVSFDGCFHGLTLGSLSLVGSDIWRHGAACPSLSTTQVPLHDLSALDQALEEEDVAALALEVVQGVGGVEALDESELMAIQDLCRGRGVLLVVDEVLTGLGRLGSWFGYQAVAPGLEPDLVIVSKGLTGSWCPFSAVLMTDEVFDATFGAAANPVLHTSTFSGYELGLHVARACFSAIRSGQLLDNARQRGRELVEGLADIGKRVRGIQDVRGQGLLVGVEVEGLDLPNDELGAAMLAQELRRERVLVQAAAHARTVLKLTPPLTINQSEVSEFLIRFERAAEAVEAERERTDGA